MKLLSLLIFAVLFALGVQTAISSTKGKDCKNYKSPPGNSSVSAHNQRCAALLSGLPSVSIPTVTLPVTTTVTIPTTTTVSGTTTVQAPTTTVQAPPPNKPEDPPCTIVPASILPMECNGITDKYKPPEVQNNHGSIQAVASEDTNKESSVDVAITNLLASISGFVGGLIGMWVWSLRAM